MAGVSHLPPEVLLSKRVQEMVINGEEPPAPYICRHVDATPEVSAALSPVPIIDLSLFSSSTPETKQKELQKLRSALSSWGCFQAIGHGMSTSFLDNIRQAAKEYFEQPMEEKKKQAKGVEEFEGYGADPVPAEGQFLDWSDRLFLDVYPEDRRKLRFWPERPESFRGLLEEYSLKIKMVTEITSKAMAKSLNLEENCFLTQFGERAQYQARFNYYARCHRPDLVLGLKPHSDGTGYTIILQDEDGLQVLKDEQWFTVPKISEALLVLMGDQMEIMTNGIFKSPVHRVVTSSEKERISVIVFYTPEVNKEIRPEDGLINEERPRLFKNVKDYADIHMEFYNRGQRALHTAIV
ncbi:2-oxoglutarate (2OG) and Fe(II)-dependent oxygenase superfamily protein [Melia azedarach]|uniref:2-oxoglutarate (2OG) and Fe(II)-dependent oxygenase superfamily protein n=2 Tax=Melia azedarach TaxID=155640 RepID=A0ACC1Y5L5_MELAZ|nr:2-oxoglutarate (2OG) and Fe(II)-dependent oxygenase superfamily protein [Melia azedarach]KAJ4718514.1 2-oxoglutarate (2OG) and Fe(II)-dependent oxygenase superfamily protein [Melia azedarach]